LRDGLSLLDQAIAYGAGAVHANEVRSMLGTIERGRVFALLQAIQANDGVALMDEIDRLAEFSPDFAGVLDDVAGALHRIQLRQLVATHASDDRGDDAAVAALAESISAEEVQLMYQIAINGRRDIALAPTPRAGFEMTLLRMLAFRPAQGDVATRSTPRVESAGKPAVSRTVTSTRTAAAVETARVPEAPTVVETKVAPTYEPSPSPPPPPPSNELFGNGSFDGDWSNLIKRAGLGGCDLPGASQDQPVAVSLPARARRHRARPCRDSLCNRVALQRQAPTWRCFADFPQPRFTESMTDY